MRIVMFGAGGVGSVIGGRLQQHADAHGHEITLVARGAHCAAIRATGLTINDPSGSVTVAVPVAEHIADVELDEGDVVFMTMKSQDSTVALDDLRRHAPAVSVVCAQNGVDNERMAARRFADVYAMCVMLPAAFMVPGAVDASGAPHNAILDIGRYPTGTDATSTAIAAALEASGLASRSIPDVMRWKHTKLLMNLANAVDALVSDVENSNVLIGPAREEAEACFAAAGIDRVSDADDQERRRDVLAPRPVPTTTLPEGTRRGGSTWQSFVRGARTTEVDWLNGEIVLLGRAHGVPTPINRLLCDVTAWAAANRVAPRSLTTEEILSRRRS